MSISTKIDTESFWYKIPTALCDRAAAEMAAVVLPIFEKNRPGDDRPRLAIEASNAWSRGEITYPTVAAARTAASRASSDAWAVYNTYEGAATISAPARAAHAACYAARATWAVAADAAHWACWAARLVDQVGDWHEWMVALLRRTWLPSLNKPWVPAGMVDGVSLWVPALPYKKIWPLVVNTDERDYAFTWDEIIESRFATVVEDLGWTPARPVNL